MKESIKIIIPIPNRILSPNRPVASRGGRIAKAIAAKKYRTTTKEAVLAQQVETAPWQRAKIEVTFYWKVKRRRDHDNAESSLKSAFDGITDSGLIPDDTPEHVERPRPIFQLDPKSPRVEIVITRLD